MCHIHNYCEFEIDMRNQKEEGEKTTFIEQDGNLYKRIAVKIFPKIYTPDILKSTI